MTVNKNEPNIILRKKNRYPYLDYVRGFFIILMIFYHFSFYYYNTTHGIIEFLLANLGGIIAPNFLLISGYSFVYFLKKRESYNKVFVAKETILKAFLIFGFATLLSILFAGYVGLTTSFQTWNIFKIIGLGMIIIYLLDQFKYSNIIILSFTILSFFIGYIYYLTQTPILWFLCYTSVFGGFAFFPWVFYYCMGFLLGRLLIKVDKNGINVSFLKKIQTPALILFISGATYFHFFSHPDYFSHFGSNIMENIGLYLIFLLIAFYRNFKLKNKILDFSKNLVVEYGNVSFSVYYIHFGLIFLTPLFDSFFLNGFFLTNMNLYLYLTLSFSVFILISIWLIIWKKLNYMLGLEWIINKIVGLIVKKDNKSIKNNSDKNQ
ncbi:MAG: heparan-alpha-glucosaminide N-acetyltransferase domain-containing protein [Candidatus Helarchaeota archaeon]